jgi:hypothetical protein
MTAPRKNAPKTRGKPFGPGNPGKPKGARHRSTIVAEALLDGQAHGLTQKAIDMALAGDTVALRLCLERLVPPRKERPLAIALPAIAGAQDHPAVLSSIFAAVASGDLTAGEAQQLSAVLEQHRRAVETADLALRIEALEGRDANPTHPGQLT